MYVIGETNIPKQIVNLFILYSISVPINKKSSSLVYSILETDAAFLAFGLSQGTSVSVHPPFISLSPKYPYPLNPTKLFAEYIPIIDGVRKIFLRGI